jgi:hypothetical protein
MMIFQSPWQNIPPAIMDSQYNGLTVFLIPYSYISTNLRMWLMFKDRTRPGVTSMPDEVYASTDVLDTALKNSLAKPGHPGASLGFKLGPFHQD